MRRLLAMFYDNRILAYLLPIASISLVTAGLVPVRLQMESATIALLYILPVGACAALSGMGPGILAAVIAFFCFNYFFLPPYGTLLVHKSQDILALAVFLIIAIIISQLVGRLIRSLSTARARENETTHLYELNQSLARFQKKVDILQEFTRHTLETFRAEKVEIDILANNLPLSFRLPEGTTNGASQAGEPTRRLPLHGNMQLQGEIRLWRANRGIKPAEDRLLGAFAQQFLLAFERSMLSDQARQAELLQATEKLQASLLNSISHDLRTPLVSITGALSSLRERSLSLDKEAGESLIETAYEQSERLNRLVGNLLNMTRLEAGAMHLKKEPCDVQDAIGAALEQLGERISRRQIKVDLPPDLELIPLDFPLFEQVLVNILDNAAKYSSPDALIEIIVQQVPGNVRIEICDRGVGIPAEDLERIFDKFYRVQRLDNVSGTGLGLAICRGIVEAHGGNVRADNRPGGGTIITVILPRENSR